MLFLNENDLHIVVLGLEDKLLHTIGRGFTTVLLYCYLLKSIVTSEVSQSGMVDHEGAMDKGAEDLTDFSIERIYVLYQTIVALLIKSGIGLMWWKAKCGDRCLLYVGAADREHDYLGATQCYRSY